MTEDKALVGRLRRTYRKEFAPTGSMVATPRTVQSRLLSVDVLFNPDGAEAADRIEALTAENERLRGALEDIKKAAFYYTLPKPALDIIHKRACAALAGEQP